jgi:hypothetical protein
MAPSVFDKYRIVLLVSEGLSIGQIDVDLLLLNPASATVKNKVNNPKACFTIEYHYLLIFTDLRQSTFIAYSKTEIDCS